MTIHWIENIARGRNSWNTQGGGVGCLFYVFYGAPTQHISYITEFTFDTTVVCNIFKFFYEWELWFRLFAFHDIGMPVSS